MANDGLIRKVAIKKGDEVEGLFYFETEDEAKKFAKDVSTFDIAVKEGNTANKEKIAKKYGKNKAYSNFFKAFEMKLLEGKEQK